MNTWDTIPDRDIVTQYKEDFSQYEREDKKLKLISIYDIIPAELNKQNKRQLLCNGFEPYFCKKKNIGELDFLIEMDGKVTYLPIYMCYLVKAQSIGQLIVDLDMEGL